VQDASDPWTTVRNICVEGGAEFGGRAGRGRRFRARLAPGVPWDTPARRCEPQARWFVDYYYAEWVREPTTVEEVNQVKGAYSRCGLPGCIGSMDAVHVAWDGCPAAWSAQYTGKEGFPTVAFNVTCHHNKKIFGVSGPHQGTRNDKSIVRYDDVVGQLRAEERFRALSRPLLNGTLLKGAYIICDGGYHAWPETLSAPKFSVDDDQARWAKRVESIRIPSLRPQLERSPRLAAHKTRTGF